ncbi:MULTISPECIES: LA_2272/LA_2273 family lipoprotein [Leptospira]|uniref:LA_2272/LA_2273 family lipoprotein n=1 Tax=Leptospira TaxID=171 RepID=UPI0002C031EE|nr:MULTISPECIES: hypothetical protein [Leptospira]EMJ59549.1 hypothetical protein LEP1GSC051_4343 [Leptospira sp. P2653]MDL5245314.1 hypothetical protein [Leptospira weilii]
MKNKINPIVYLFFLLFWIATTNCGFALTPRITTRIPPKTETEVFRLNLLYGELKNLVGLNVGLMNIVEHRMTGGQVGIVNLSGAKTYGAQIAVVNVSNGMIGGQVGIVNFSDGKTYGAQIAIVNWSGSKSSRIQAGIVNFTIGHDSNGLQAGLVNIGSKGSSDSDRFGFDLTIGAGNFDTRGVNIGILNEKASGFNVGALNIKSGGVNVGILNGGTGVHIGLINASGEEETDEPTIQFGFLNFCGKGTFPVMIGFNYCK